jgi:hypothetical protein
MSDDRLLSALGQLAREQRKEKTPPAELLSPPSQTAKDRIVAQALSAMATRPSEEQGSPKTAAAAPAPTRRRGRRWLWLGAPVAMAAALALWLRVGTPPEMLPRYAMETSGGTAAYRGAAPDAEAPLAIAAGSTVEVRLRPEVDATQTVAARGFWVKGSDVRPWSALVETSSGGAVRMRGPGEQPFGPGDGELVTVVAAQVPADVTAATLASPPAGWQVLRRRVSWR